MNPKILIALLALTAMPALPSTITFGTGGSTGFTSGGTNSVTVNDAGGYLGLTLTVTAGVLSPGSCAPQCWLTASNAGYGVDNSAPAGGATDSSTDIDGSGNNDFISLVFNRVVVLSAATFGNFGSTDHGEFYNMTSGAVLVSAFSSSSLSGLSVHGTSFQFAATGTNDDYRLLSVTIVPNPEPGTMGMTAVGVIGLLAFGRRRMRNQA